MACLSDLLCPCHALAALEGGGKPAAGLPSNRVALDVGGTPFVAASSTLAAHSSYFASALPNERLQWNREGTALFLDQDPVAFNVLLAYMRRGFIRVEDIDADVLALADHLGMERLLLAIKARWYVNIGRGPVLSHEEDIAAAFDRLHGGIRRAISSGLLPIFQRRDEMNAERDMAILVLSADEIPRRGASLEDLNVSVYKQLGKGKISPAIHCGLIGALNGLHANGFAVHGHEVVRGFDVHHTHSLTFSRLRHEAMRCTTTDVLVPADDEVRLQRELNATKQFALHIKDMLDGSETVLTPAEFDGDANPYSEATIEGEDGEEDCMDFWLEKNDFVTREMELEAHPLLNWYLNFLRVMSGGVRSARMAPLTCELYSRRIARTPRQKMARPIS